MLKIKRKTGLKRLREAAVKDGISYITGLLPVLRFIPFNFICLFCPDIIGYFWPRFVDWELPSWPVIYHKELDLAVRLPYRGKEYLLPQVLFFDNINRDFELSRITLCLEEPPFKLNDKIYALTEDSFRRFSRTRRFYNQENLRLVNITEANDRVKLSVQSVEYKDYARTNLLLDAKPGNKSQTLREYLHKNGGLENLNESPLGNNLGINILLLTADGTLVIQRRSKKVAFRQGEFFPSVSGTFSLHDVSNNEVSLEQMPILREACEETGVKIGDVPAGKMFFLGITRELIRGGEPDMFFFAETNLSEKDMRRNWNSARDRWESKNLLFYHFGDVGYKKLATDLEKYQFLLHVDSFLDKYLNNAGVTLLTAVALWIRLRLGESGDSG